MKERFYHETVVRLLGDEWLRRDDDLLVVAGGAADRDVMLAAGIPAVTITNLDERVNGDEYAPYSWSYQDAENLDYRDGSFDVCVVHQGLHHCRSPHRALLEMYRVARRGIVVFEPQETMLTRLGVRLGLGQQYELAAVAANDLRWGGVNNTAIPNYVYRWTEREVRKVLAAYDPTGVPPIRCYYDLRVPGERADDVRSRPMRIAARAAVPVARVVLRLFPEQANAIALVVNKVQPVDLHPWLKASSDGVRVDQDWFGPRDAPACSESAVRRATG